MNDYHKGRLAIIDELIQFCEHQRDKIKVEGDDPDTLKRCTKTGVMSAYATMIQKLKVKKNKLSQEPSKG